MELSRRCVSFYMGPAHIHCEAQWYLFSFKMTLGYPPGSRCRIVLICNSMTKCPVKETKLYRHFDGKVSDKSFVMDSKCPSHRRYCSRYIKGFPVTCIFNVTAVGMRTIVYPAITKCVSRKFFLHIQLLIL